MGQVSDKVRAQVYERDEYQCTASRMPGACRGHMDIGHIIGRGMGGGDRYDSVEWLLSQCRWHNGQIEDGKVALAEKYGMHISRNSTALIPDRACVRYPDGQWYWLNPDGTKERIDESVWLQSAPATS